MDAANTFKSPTSLDGKHKFVARKPADKPPPAELISAVETTEQKPVETEVETDRESSTDPAPPPAPAPPKPRSPAAANPAAKPPQCPYVEPQWSAAPADADTEYSIEMLKGGTIVERVRHLQRQAHWLIGKLPDNRIVMAHPTVSRYHAVLQYRPEAPHSVTEAEGNADASDSSSQSAAPSAPTKPKIAAGWYLYDLGSTHGSFVNKRKIPPRCYVRVRVGYMLSFGGSTRRLIVQGPEADAEQESEIGITEMKELRHKEKLEQLERVQKERAEKEEAEKQREAAGVSWGMQEDADEETDLSVNPYATTTNEELFLQDPKKTLRGYFEREGLELEYKVEELSQGSFVCKIELPICDPSGRPIRCEVSHKGKKKECVVQGALEACRILDRHGVLRQSHHESRKRKIAHSDSDGDDDFYDRTGTVERKRQQKEAAAAAATNDAKALTYDELCAQERELLQKLDAVKGRIVECQLGGQRAKEAKALGDSNEDDLDGFMAQLGNDCEPIDNTTIRRLRVEAKEIEAEHKQLQRLIRIARPVDLPPLLAVAEAKPDEKKKLALPLFGKRGTFKFAKAVVEQKSVEGPMVTENEVENGGEKEDKDVPEEVEAVEKSAEISIPIETSPVKSMEISESTPKPTPPAPDQQVANTKSDEKVTTSEVNDSAAAAKKKRSRQRIRGEKPRDNIDMDEPTELMTNSEKYSTWVPPENQSGDGSTSLNDKFGY